MHLKYGRYTELFMHCLQVESLIGRASITAAALGDQHSLFLDSSGHVWSCGENKEGQCGLGTPVEVLAAQHRKAFYEGHFKPRELQKVSTDVAR